MTLALQSGLPQMSPNTTFDFLTDQDLVVRNTNSEVWFPVPEVAEMTPAGLEWSDWLAERGLGNSNDCRRRLHALIHAVHTSPVISHYQEESDSVDHVLNISFESTVAEHHWPFLICCSASQQRSGQSLTPDGKLLGSKMT